MLANAFADQFFSGHVVGYGRPGHSIGEVGCEVYRKTGRL
jgi:hypothetical protein